MANNHSLQVSLIELSLGQAAVVAGVNISSSNAMRLLEMGITPGVKIQLIRYAPLGDPMEIAIGDYHLIIRHSEAKDILVHVSD